MERQIQLHRVGGVPVDLVDGIVSHHDDGAPRVDARRDFGRGDDPAGSTALVMGEQCSVDTLLGLTVDERCVVGERAAVPVQ